MVRMCLAYIAAKAKKCGLPLCNVPKPVYFCGWKRTF